MDRAAPPAPRSRRRIGSLLVLVAALGFMGWVLYDLLGVEPVQVVASRLVRAGGSVSIAGELRNTGPDSGKLDVEIRYYDSHGRTLGREVVAIEQLKSGESKKFTTPARALDGVSEFSIYLNHGPNPYGN